MLSREEIKDNYRIHFDDYYRKSLAHFCKILEKPELNQEWYERLETGEFIMFRYIARGRLFRISINMTIRNWDSKEIIKVYLYKVRFDKTINYGRLRGLLRDLVRPMNRHTEKTKFIDIICKQGVLKEALMKRGTRKEVDLTSKM